MFCRTIERVQPFLLPLLCTQGRIQELSIGGERGGGGAVAKFTLENAKFGPKKGGGDAHHHTHPLNPKLPRPNDYIVYILVDEYILNTCIISCQDLFHHYFA